MAGKRPSEASFSAAARAAASAALARFSRIEYSVLPDVRFTVGPLMIEVRRNSGESFMRFENS